MLDPKKYWASQIWDLKNVGTKNVGSKKCWALTNFWFQKSLGQILAPKIFVKIRSVTAETFLIWTNVARTNVARINVTMTIGICKRWYQEHTIKVWSKSD